MNLLTINKPNPTHPTSILCSELQSRLPWKLHTKELMLKNTYPAEKQKQEEAKLLLKYIPRKACIIALDENGKNYDSQKFASHIQSIIETYGETNIIFIIGGAYGLDACIKERADYLVSLSPMTWPHRIAKLLLVEQLYRASTLISGHPYHK